jgi:hypothetical protein
LLHRTSSNVILTGCAVLSLSLLAMALGAPVSAPIRAEGELTPTPTLRGVVLFEDDFATYSGRWVESESPKASVAYRDGALVIRVVSPGVYSWSVPDFDAPLRDYRVEVTADVRGGSADSLVGFVLGHRDDEHFYAVLTTPQGEWVFLRRQGNEFEDLTPPDAAPLDLTPDDEALRLRADVVGAEVSLWINDQLAGRVTVTDGLTGADFGLIARAGRGYVDVSFDDCVVTGIVGEAR